MTKKEFVKTLCIAWIFGFGSTLGATAQAQLDLHAHLDMKPGMGILLREGPNSSQTWNSRLQAKESLSTLSALHAPKLTVVSLYAHPVLSKLSRLPHFDPVQNVRDTLEEEYTHLLEFVKNNSQTFGIARTPKEARAFLSDRKNVFVLSIEGAYGALETEADLKKWIDERGVAILTPFHLTEDHFGGVALMRPWAALFNTPIRFLQSLLITNFSCLSHICTSPMGVKPDGDVLIQNLIKRKVWIDLAHANDMEIREILPELEAQKIPVLVTHTEVREVYAAERGLSPLVTDYLAKNGGIIGLIPTDDLIERSTTRSASGCTSGVSFFRDVFRSVQKQLGESRVALGSDINAPITGLAPTCRNSKVAVHESLHESVQTQSLLEENGYATYSQWNELGDYVSGDPAWNTKIVDSFLNTWERVRDGRSEASH